MRRVERLEASSGPRLTAACRRWLGHVLTADERRQADREDASFKQPDLSRLSPETRAWLAA